MSDIEITCSDCRTPFVFTAAEQAFFDEKGFANPKRCKSCRTARKANNDRGNDRGNGNSRDNDYRSNDRADDRRSGSGDRRGGYRNDRQDDRQYFDATCAECGAKTQVPFQPKPDRDVFCRDCFKARAPRY